MRPPGVSGRSAAGVSLRSRDDPAGVVGRGVGAVPVFQRRGTFVVFTVLATGLVAATGRRSVVGMLAGARMAQQVSFHAACRFSPRRCGTSTGWA